MDILADGLTPLLAAATAVYIAVRDLWSAWTKFRKK